MVHKSYGIRHKTRNKLTSKEAITVNRILKKFNVGDSVYVSIAPAFHNFPHPKFNGKTGKIIAKRGNCYIIEVKDMSAKKKIIAHPVHMKKHQ